MELKNIEVIDDPDGEEIELSFSDDAPIKFISSDPFSKGIDGDAANKLSGRKLRRRYNDLAKVFEGESGAGAKHEEEDGPRGYDLFQVVEPPYNIEALAQLYDEHAIHHACIDARVMNTVGLGNSWDQTLKAERKTEKVAGDADKRDRWRKTLQREAEDLNLKIDSLNVEDSFQETLIKIWTDTLATGNGYMEIGRNQDGSIGYIGHIPAKLIRVRKPRDGFVQYAVKTRAIFFRNFGDTETPNPFGNDPNPNEILHFKMYSPTNNFYGIPPAVSAAAAIMGDKYAKEYNIDYFENKAIPRYAIIIKGVKLSEKSKKELVNYFRKEVKGKNHGTLLIPLPTLTGSGKDTDIKFEKLEADVTDASFDKYRKANRDEIVSAYRVPPTKISIYEDANLAISRDGDKTFKTQVVGPDQVIIAKKLNRIIIEFSENLLWEFKQLDLIDEDIKSRIHDRYLRTQVLTPNDVRLDIGEIPREGADDPLTWTPDAKMIADEKQREFTLKHPETQPGGGGNEGNTNATESGPRDNPTTSQANRRERGAVQDTAEARDRVGGE
jgi:PBSX family phage portal protein